MADAGNSLEFPVIENFSPEVSIEIYGINKTIKIVAIVDTSFSGFLQVPLATGISANLNILSIGRHTLADGSSVKTLQCVGKIRFAAIDLVGVVLLSEKSDACFAGMQFLRQLNMDFTISPSRKKAIFQSLQQPSPAIEKPKPAAAEILQDKKN